MTDRVSRDIRRAIMSSVGTRDTRPEMKVRRALHRLGYRYRLHRRDLPGRPDIVFPARRKVIFVHGCFWHGHDCRWGRPPKSREEYWLPKIQENRDRDRRNLNALRESHWQTFVVWQCELREFDSAIAGIVDFLECLAENAE